MRVAPGRGGEERFDDRTRAPGMTRHDGAIERTR